MSLQTRAFSALLDLVKFIPLIDSFASRLSTKLPKYVSWSFDPFTYKLNAFSFHWPNNVCVFRPINLLEIIVRKIDSEQLHNVLLITLSWKGLTCLPFIISHLIIDPILISSVYVEGRLPTRYPCNWMSWSTFKFLQNSRHISRSHKRSHR